MILLLILLQISPTLTDNWDRIIGGFKVSIENYPYQLSLHFNNHFICGATIISEKFALSAAHCVRIPGSYTIHAGSSLRKSPTIVFIKQAIIHPKFDSTNSDFDISILKFAQNLQFNDKIQAIKLPGFNDFISKNAFGVVTGWGVTDSRFNKIPIHLRAVLVPIFDWKTCELVYPFGVITKNMICAGFWNGGKDSCRGDSGGPFVIDGKLFGIVSWGFDCAQPGYPGVYTNVPKMRNFINYFTGL